MSGKSKGGNTVAAVWELAEPIAQGLGFSLWDVRFTKEGASWYLRIYIDKDEGISLDDCEAMSHAIDAPLDELDPIEQSYFLEVCSPGVGRELTRPEHYELLAGCDVTVTLFRPIDGQKEITACLIGLEDKKIILEDENGERIEIDKKDASCVRLYEEL